ncbi:MAG: nucleotide exchange factor GrpE [Candidatus Gracilibacteria bacterium]|nr:nucleotide exchange factor GrpE [Candidatus Gracilibacteria bacterium]
MTQDNDNLNNEELKDLEESLQEDLKNIQNQEENKDSNYEDRLEQENKELKEALARKQADYVNFQKRTQRDREDTIFFLTKKIIEKILPTIDNLERIINNTPENNQTGTLYEAVVSNYKSLLKTLDELNIKPFNSKGEQVNPDKHEVMTQIPGEEGIIVDEFEKGYIMGDKIIRVAKVVVGNGQ